MASTAVAAPRINLDSSFHEGQTTWDVSITPDVAAFVPGTSLVAQIDVSVHGGSLLGAVLNDDVWNVDEIEPGNNPFTGAPAMGLIVDLTGKTLFVSAESQLPTNPNPLPLMSFATEGRVTNINIGLRPVLAGTPEAYMSSRITQNGINFDGVNRSAILEYFSPLIGGLRWQPCGGQRRFDAVTRQLGSRSPADSSDLDWGRSHGPGRWQR